MNEISNIHAFEDEDFLHACFVWGMVVVGVFAVCLVPVFMLLGGPADLDAADAGGWMAVVGWIVGLAAISMASFAVHELVHGVFFKLLAPTGAKVPFGANRETAMIYACAEGGGDDDEARENGGKGIGKAYEQSVALQVVLFRYVCTEGNKQAPAYAH